MSVGERSTSTSVLVRSLESRDLPEVIALERDIFPDPWSITAFEQQLADGWGGLVALSGEKVVGYLCSYRGDIEAHITNIAIAPTSRRAGVGTALLEAYLSLVRKTPSEYILLEVRAGNSEAQAFYARHGFRFLYRRKGYYRRPVEDALVMVRYLAESQEER